MLTSPAGPLHVVVAGGGFASLETMLALRAIGGARARISLVAPQPVFTYRPAAPAEAFEDGDGASYDLRTIADDLGASYHQARVEAVGAEHGYVRLSSGTRVTYDDLVLAVGARPTMSIAGATTFRDQRDQPLFAALLDEVLEGLVGEVVLAVPAGHSWPLPLYELALRTAGLVSEHRLTTRITIASPEAAPLAAFGTRASELVAGMLDARGIAFVGDVVPRLVRADGGLLLESGAVLPANRVIAVPQLRGRKIAGLAADWQGFVATDADGRVQGLERVYAAGDMTAFPIKQAGMATQQADRIAETILTGGANGRTVRSTRILQARLLGGEFPAYLRVELDGAGRPASSGLARIHRDVPAHEKVLARYLTPYLGAYAARASAACRGQHMRVRRTLRSAATRSVDDA